MLIVFLYLAAKQTLDSSDSGSDCDGKDALLYVLELNFKTSSIEYALWLLCFCSAVLVQYNTIHVWNTTSTEKPFMNFILAPSEACLFFSNTRISTSTSKIYSGVKEPKKIAVKIEKFA